jgi:ribonuclease HI
LGAGIVLTSPKNDQLRYVPQIHFATSNNVPEYEALVHGLKVAKEIGIHRIMCYGDSNLVVQQILALGMQMMPTWHHIGYRYIGYARKKKVGNFWKLTGKIRIELGYLDFPASGLLPQSCEFYLGGHDFSFKGHE